MKNILLLLVLLASLTVMGQNEEEWQVRFSNGTLKGTLLMPKTASKTVVLLLAGSGPTDRNGNNPFAKNNSLKMLAQALANNNIASLRVDKRTIGASRFKNLDESKISFDDFVNDVIKWVDTLKQTKKFNKIWIAGHSQGSLVGMIAAYKTKVSGFISLAGAGSNIADIIKQQLSNSAKPIKQASYQILDSLIVGKQVKNVSPILFSLFRPSVQPFWISWMKYYPEKEIQKLKIPILIINGTTDLQVAVSEAEKLHQANQKSMIIIIEGMNHVLKPAPNDKQANLKTYSQPNLPLHKDLVPTLVDFIQNH
jgi:pimeloyl-ACP methyl ester carboxylesterase